jgi:PKHD-type hydroxylase
VSFTLFLAAPEEYDGGELIIDTSAGEEAFKLAAGSVITYPATTLHRVAPVTRGERLVAAGWVRSYVRDPARRELLFDLETVRHRCCPTGAWRRSPRGPAPQSTRQAAALSH